MSAIHQPDPTSRIILGIDPGVAIVGYAVVEARGDALRMIACDVIRTPAGLPLAPRLQQIYQQLDELVTNYRPQEAAIEELFFGRNVSTAIAVGQARGVTMLALADRGLSIAEYTPNEVKLAVTGYGAAKKEQVGEMVRLLLHLTAIPRPDDAADAAAIAICHAHTVRYSLEEHIDGLVRRKR
jgi:crossover junction endodeoxyribonuclease RuvC